MRESTRTIRLLDLVRRRVHRDAQDVVIPCLQWAFLRPDLAGGALHALRLRPIRSGRARPLRRRPHAPRAGSVDDLRRIEGVCVRGATGEALYVEERALLWPRRGDGDFELEMALGAAGEEDWVLEYRPRWEGGHRRRW